MEIAIFLGLAIVLYLVWSKRLKGLTMSFEERQIEDEKTKIEERTRRLLQLLDGERVSTNDHDKAMLLLGVVHTVVIYGIGLTGNAEEDLRVYRAVTASLEQSLAVLEPERG